MRDNEAFRKITNRHPVARYRMPILLDAGLVPIAKTIG